MYMKTRLDACDTWHPETPARFKLHKSGKDSHGNYRHRQICIECQRIKVMEHRHRMASQRPYGVIRLNWAPPQL